MLAETTGNRSTPAMTRQSPAFACGTTAVKASKTSSRRPRDAADYKRVVRPVAAALLRVRGGCRTAYSHFHQLRGYAFASRGRCDEAGSGIAHPPGRIRAQLARPASPTDRRKLLRFSGRAVPRQVQHA